MNLGGDGRSLFLSLHPSRCARNLKRLLRNRLHSCGGVCIYVCGIYMSQPIPYSHRFPCAALAHAHKTVLLLTLHCFRALFCPILRFGATSSYRSSRAPAARSLSHHVSAVAGERELRWRPRERERARERSSVGPLGGFSLVSIIGSQERKSIRKRKRTVSNAVKGVV